jgi:hypothetical protein
MSNALKGLKTYLGSEAQGRWVVIIALSLAALFLCRPVFAEFNSSGWKRYRSIQIPADFAEGPAAIILESGVIDRCRPDLGDLRVLGSNGMPALIAITDPTVNNEARPFTAQVFRVAKTAGKWTDIAIDKTSKVLTGSIVIGTRSKDFIRKVEIRGSDNVRDAYVIRMDGLIADLGGDVPLSSLKLVHPLNNFQYIFLRILDGDQPQLKIDSIQCCPPDPETPMARSLDVRILENRTDEASGSTRIVADLGERRASLTQLAFATSAKEFVKKIRVHVGSSPNPDSWKKVHEATIFRLRKDEAVNERLKVRLSPQPFRYILIELYGGRSAVKVDKLEATGTMRLAIFEYRRGFDYRLLYDNPTAEGMKAGSGEAVPNLPRIVLASSDIRLGEEERNVVDQPHKVENQPETGEVTLFWKLLGVIMLTVGLLLMFSLMLRARSLRKSVRGRNSRIINTRI